MRTTLQQLNGDDPRVVAHATIKLMRQAMFLE